MPIEEHEKATPHLHLGEGACGVVVSRLLCMQKASGSNPDKSIPIFLLDLRESVVSGEKKKVGLKEDLIPHSRDSSVGRASD